MSGSSLPERPAERRSLESLRKEAKRWLKALRDGVEPARARLQRALPDAPPAPTLRDVQHALARELGFPGWRALRERLTADATPASPEAVARETIVRRFLDAACPDHHVRGATDHLRARATAMRLLGRHPWLAHENIYTAVVCGELDVVTRLLAERPALATARDAVPGPARTGVGGAGDLRHRDLGAKGWDPLLHLCFTRLPLPAVEAHAVETARLLLDHGADPNTHFMAGDSRYTPLVGAVGEGEEDRPPHPRRDELVRLLLERGAEPYDTQVIYDIHFRGDVRWWLELMYEHAVRRGRRADWDDPEWSMLDMGSYGSGARWHLWLAVRHGDLALAEWCLAHGASPEAAPPHAPSLPQGTPYEMAVRAGQQEIASLLVRYGARPVDVVVSDLESFTAACLRMDVDAVRAWLARRPELLEAPEPLLAAAGKGRADVVRLLLDLGASTDVEGPNGERPLHAAAAAGAVEVAALLIERGAEVDPVERRWDNTPLGSAVWARHEPMIALLGRHSRDVRELVHIGNVARLRDVLRERPDRGRVEWDGQTPLMRLPADDESRAIETAELLLAHGADAARRDGHGMTAADRAERMGMLALAALLRAAADPSPARRGLARYERMATDLFDAYETGNPDALRRHWRDAGHRRGLDAMRTYVQLGLGRRPDADGRPAPLTMDGARLVVAKAHGFESWHALADGVASQPSERVHAGLVAAKPVRLVGRDGTDEDATTRDWDEAIERLGDGSTIGLDAGGEMTDALLARLVERVAAAGRAGQVGTLRLAGSEGLSDDGLRPLARLPALTRLDLSGCPVGDRGLAVLRELPALETLALGFTRITDDGAAHLAGCPRLARVNLMETRTGDGALRALAGRASLHHLHSGALVTDAGLDALHDYPAFRAWQGGETSMALLSADAGPNLLALRGAVTDAGLARLRGLDGLFALNVDDSRLAIGAAGVAALAALPHLGWLGVDADDGIMAAVATLPHLRFLMAQDAPASDDGWVALAGSRTIEHIWGRRCHGLRGAGFRALSRMPALCALSVSCLNVDDAALATLPDFPALRELMPMDVPDAGYRHIGRCERLESLVLMYCRETTDAATEHLVGLPRLARYFASYTRITDRTPELLARIASLERVELVGCAGVTDAGIAALARLPRLRELRLAEMQRVTRAVAAAFPAAVRVRYEVS